MLAPEGRIPRGRVCVKAYGLVQKTYNPDRIQTPMKRTNPVKSRDEDPGFVPITWDEALDLIADKLREVQGKGLADESGYPRVAASYGGGGTPTQYMGTFPALLAAIGKVDLGFGAGQGVKCYHSEHLYGELWHRAFIVAPDTPGKLYPILRAQRRCLNRRCRHMASCRCQRPRHEACAGGTPSIRDRCRMCRMGSNQAQN